MSKASLDFQDILKGMEAISHTEEEYLVAPNEDVAYVLRRRYPNTKVYISEKLPEPLNPNHKEPKES